MQYVWLILIAAVCSVLWRVRGGLWEDIIPANKIWFALFVGFLAFWTQDFDFEIFANVSIATFAAHQLCSWGVYIGRELMGGNIDPEVDKENPLIDEIILPLHIKIKGQTYYLYQFPRLYGFIGTTLTGLMMSYMMGLAIGSFWYGFAGIAMGVCYWLGSLLNKVKPDYKGGWNYGEYIYGFYQGAWIYSVLFIYV